MVIIGIMSTSAIVDKVLPSLCKFSSVRGCASRDRDRAQAFCDARGKLFSDSGNGSPRGYTHAEMIADDEIDALYIPLPTSVRNEWIRKVGENLHFNTLYFLSLF